jgi:hypothetical protein
MDGLIVVANIAFVATRRRQQAPWPAAYPDAILGWMGGHVAPIPPASGRCAVPSSVGPPVSATL